MSLPNFYDTLRYLVRASRFADEEQRRNALLAIDAKEAGFDSTDAYLEELGARAAAAAQETPAPAGETADQRIARLEMENANLRAQAGAAAKGPAEAPA